VLHRIFALVAEKKIALSLTERSRFLGSHLYAPDSESHMQHGMLLARATARQHEIPIRVAIGTSNARLIRPLFTASLLLGLLGSVVGLLCGRYLAGASSEPSHISRHPK
jgi:hypothetical protein